MIFMIVDLAKRKKIIGSQLLFGIVSHPLIAVTECGIPSVLDQAQYIRRNRKVAVKNHTESIAWIAYGFLKPHAIMPHRKALHPQDAEESLPSE